MINVVSTTGIVGRRRKTALGQSGMYFMIFCGPHHTVKYSPARPDSYGVIALSQVETLSVE